MIRKTVFYTGHVQGVFFRATAREVSRDFAVTGTVRNLPDGRVELIAEGERAEVDRFLRAVREAKRQHITDESIDETVASGQFPDFRVAY